MQLLSIDSPVTRFLEFLFELIILNLLTIICCLPVVTVGPAVTALYRSVFNMRLGAGYTVKGYFKAFKENFRPASLLSLICIAICVSFLLYIFLLRDLLAAGNVLTWIAIFAVGAFFFFPMTFVFPLLSKFESGAIKTLINSILLSVRHIFTAAVTLILHGIPIALLIARPSWFLVSLPIWFFIGFALIAWLASGLFLRIFRQYAEL